MRVLDREGPDVSLAGIAAEANVAKPRLYRHFADKADIIAAVGDRLGDEVWRRLTAALDPDDAPVVMVRRGLAAFLAVVDEHPNAFLSLIATGGQANGQAERLLDAGTRIAGVISTVLVRQLEPAGVDTAGAEPWGHALAGAVGGATTWWLEHRSIGKEALIGYLEMVVRGALEGILSTSGISLDLERPVRSQIDHY